MHLRPFSPDSACLCAAVHSACGRAFPEKTPFTGSSWVSPGQSLFPSRRASWGTHGAVPASHGNCGSGGCSPSVSIPSPPGLAAWEGAPVNARWCAGLGTSPRAPVQPAPGPPVSWPLHLPPPTTAHRHRRGVCGHACRSRRRHLGASAALVLENTAQALQVSQRTGVKTGSPGGAVGALPTGGPAGLTWPFVPLGPGTRPAQAADPTAQPCTFAFKLPRVFPRNKKETVLYVYLHILHHKLFCAVCSAQRLSTPLLSRHARTPRILGQARNMLSASLTKDTFSFESFTAEAIVALAVVIL